MTIIIIATIIVVLYLSGYIIYVSNKVYNLENHINLIWETLENHDILVEDYIIIKGEE